MLQGSANIILAQHSTVKGVRERRRLASAIEPHAKNDAIELKQSRLDPMSVEPTPHLVHLGGYAVAITANFNNVHWSNSPRKGDLGYRSLQLCDNFGTGWLPAAQWDAAETKRMTEAGPLFDHLDTRPRHTVASSGYIATTRRLASGLWSIWSHRHAGLRAR
jgi:hypothetical protein